MSEQEGANSARTAEVRGQVDLVALKRRLHNDLASATTGEQRERRLEWIAPVSIGDALALIEVVEAWDDFAGEWGHSSNCYHRASARGWTPGDPPMLDCVCGLARLEEALSKVSSDA